MTTLTQLTTRRYLPDGSPKDHWIATGGIKPTRRTNVFQYLNREGGVIYLPFFEFDEYHFDQPGNYYDIIASRWLKGE